MSFFSLYKCCNRVDLSESSIKQSKGSFHCVADLFH